MNCWWSCARISGAGAGRRCRHFYFDFGRFRLKWECHTEFATYTFAQHHAQPCPVPQAFAEVPLRHLPQQWLLRLQGRLMVAAHVVLEQGEPASEALEQDMQRIFEGKLMASSKVLQAEKSGPTF